MNLEAILDTLHKQSRPALHVIPAGSSASFSKIGGLPNLPADIAWPEWKGESLSFLAQFDLAELPQPLPIPGLPSSGYLYFFYDQEQSTWGFDPQDRGSWQVIYTTNPPSPAPRPAPDDILEEGLFIETPVTFKQILSAPDFQRLQLPDGIAPDVLEAAQEQVYEQRGTVWGDYPQHQIGGFPNPVQNDTMETECQLASNGLYCGDSSGYNDPKAAALASGTEDWRLLFQLDTDDDAGMMWGDCGMIYFWVRSEDLKRRDFSNVWMVLQCC